MDWNKPLRIAGLLMVINAVLHFFTFIVAGIVAGFHPETYEFMVIGLVYALIAWALWRGVNWVAYLMFVIALIGAVGSYAQMGTPPIASWWLCIIMLMDIAVAAVLFRYHWAKA